jgi:hypothetical protein
MFYIREKLSKYFEYNEYNNSEELEWFTSSIMAFFEGLTDKELEMYSKNAYDMREELNSISWPFEEDCRKLYFSKRSKSLHY